MRPHKFPRGIRKLAFLWSVMLFLSTAAFGFCLQPHPSIACDFLNSSAVFTGRVISVHMVEKDGSTDGYYYRLSVLQMFRGSREKIVEVYTGNDSGGYYLDLGKEYLIFASRDPNNSQLTISNCDNNAPLADASKLISEIQKVRISQDGIIEGLVVLHYVPNKGVPGIMVTIKGKDKNGKNKRYRLTTDRQGSFRARVPQGMYSIDIESTPSRRIVTYDLNYGGNPDIFSVHAGRCVGFEFIADPSYN